MNNCIFTPHCTECLCDKSCPILVETAYLLERNGIKMSSSVFKCKEDKNLNWPSINRFVNKMESEDIHIGVIKSRNTIKISEIITYLEICNHWQGSRLHCTVYNLKYAKYIEDTKLSWSLKSNNDNLDYIKIWAETSNYLIISNLDYVNFKDFECQTLLSILQSRESNGLKTIVVIPEVNLIGDSKFLPRLTDILKNCEVKANI